MSHKVLFVHADEQYKFAHIALKDLQAMTAGVGADWPDNYILAANGIRTVSTSNYESLYKILAAKRFDIYPRGVNQALSELRYNAEQDIAVERDWVRYPAPLYFMWKKITKNLPAN